jgi:hypothetical protein
MGVGTIRRTTGALCQTMCARVGSHHSLVPKVSAALWERSPRRDSVSPPAHDDFKRVPAADPHAIETEFRLTYPFPKRSANFGNERKKVSAMGAAA